MNKKRYIEKRASGVLTTEKFGHREIVWRMSWHGLTFEAKGHAYQNLSDKPDVSTGIRWARGRAQRAMLDALAEFMSPTDEKTCEREKTHVGSDGVSRIYWEWRVVKMRPLKTCRKTITVVEYR